MGACSKSTTVNKGDEVTVLFSIKNKSGMRIDNSYLPNDTLPLRLIVGNGYLIANIDTMLIGMKEGENKTSVIFPEKAYSKEGIYYLDSKGKKVYIIDANDTLTINIHLQKIVAQTN